METLRSNRAARWPVVLLTALAAGCGVEKSENPLSPSIAGPIAGVEISAPRASEPAPGAKLKPSQQPLRLMAPPPKLSKNRLTPDFMGRPSFRAAWLF